MRLAEVLNNYNYLNPLVIGLARGGVVVAAEIAKFMRAPMRVIVVCKISSPDQPELAIGAVTVYGDSFFDQTIAGYFCASDEQLDHWKQNALTKAKDKKLHYGMYTELPPLEDKTVILVDDGLATGATAKAAIRTLQNARKLILAIPVGAKESINGFRDLVNNVVCLHEPRNFYAVSQWYDHFGQVSDEEVNQLLSGLAET